MVLYNKDPEKNPYSIKKNSNKIWIWKKSKFDKKKFTEKSLIPKNPDPGKNRNFIKRNPGKMSNSKKSAESFQIRLKIQGKSQIPKNPDP